MSNFDVLTIQVVSVAGPAFAFGLVFGWILAITHFGGSSGGLNTHDKEDRGE
jgi:hypothetical protein